MPLLFFDGFGIGVILDGKRIGEGPTQLLISTHMPEKTSNRGKIGRRRDLDWRFVLVVLAWLPVAFRSGHTTITRSLHVLILFAYFVPF